MDNFPISGRHLPDRFIQAVVRVKRCAANVNADLELLDDQRRRAIVAACDELLGGAHTDQFPVDVFQTGSGTSTNMNVNEVIARLCGDASMHPNDHVTWGRAATTPFPPPCTSPR